MSWTAGENLRVRTIEKMLNHIQVALNNLASKSQLYSLLNIRQSEINKLQDDFSNLVDDLVTGFPNLDIPNIVFNPGISQQNAISVFNNESGKLIKSSSNIINSQGNIVGNGYISVNGGVINRGINNQIESITFANNRTIEISRDEEGKISSISDSARTWTINRENNMIIGWTVEE